jgi:hypothetical protein
VTLVAVLLAIVGAAGAAEPSAFTTAAVAADVTLPSQFAAVTVTVIALVNNFIVEALVSIIEASSGFFLKTS